MLVIRGLIFGGLYSGGLYSGSYGILILAFLIKSTFYREKLFARRFFCSVKVKVSLDKV